MFSLPLLLGLMLPESLLVRLQYRKRLGIVAPRYRRRWHPTGRPNLVFPVRRDRGPLNNDRHGWRCERRERRIQHGSQLREFVRRQFKGLIAYRNPNVLDFYCRHYSPCSATTSGALHGLSYCSVPRRDILLPASGDSSFLTTDFRHLMQNKPSLVTAGFPKHSQHTPSSRGSLIIHLGCES